MGPGWSNPGPNNPDSAVTPTDAPGMTERLADALNLQRREAQLIITGGLIVIRWVVLAVVVAELTGFLSLTRMVGDRLRGAILSIAQ